MYGSAAIGPDGTVYVGCNDNKVYAWTQDGTPKWTYPTGGIILWGSPVVGSDGTIYIESRDGKVYALTDNGASASLKWFYSTGGTRPDGTPAIGPDGTVYATSKYSGAGQGVIAFGPVSNFTSDFSPGQAPLTVQFTDTSTLSGTSWQWDFGDGSNENATQQNPVHTYTTGGTYTVKQYITYNKGTNYVIRTNYINVYSPPVAGFTSNIVAGKSPLSVTFTDTSTGNPTSWLWNFGDGSTSTEQNPTHTYSLTGTDTVTYTVNLTATNAADSNLTSRTNYITLYSTAPIVSFTGTPRVSGIAPQTVQFNDTSTLDPTSWNWSFGDGTWFNTTDSTKRNASHSYANWDSYTVSLTATNAIGSSTLSQPGYITLVSPAPISYNGASIYVSNHEGVKYDFQGTQSTHTPNTYDFSFGTGGTTPLSITADPSNSGQVTRTINNSGTFWLSFNGGLAQPTMHEGILMLAVNGTIPDDFSLHIRSSGYNWTQDTAGNLYENSASPTDARYVEGALDETFNKSDFLYGPQNWKPCSSSGYPIYGGENQSDPTNQFQIMFIDLRAGALKLTGIDNGDIKVEYSFNNLTSFAVFNSYGWFSKSNHGTGIIMTNDVGNYGYQVTGIQATPVANFTTSTNYGWYTRAPIQFTDTSTNLPQSWSWDFGEGNTSTLQNPTHTYVSGGNYTVNLTAKNVKGTSSTTQSVNITVPSAPVVGFYATSTSGTSPLSVSFIDTSSYSPIAWFWDFGDGTNSTSQNPVHWYAPGTYSVNLTATNGGGTTSLVKTGYIKVTSNGVTNQFINPGFETSDLTGWTAGTATSVSSTQKHSGSYSVYFPPSHGGQTYVAQHVDLTNLSSISFWGYHDGSGMLNQYFYTYIDGNQVQRDTAAQTWTQYTIPANGYTGIHVVQVEFDYNSMGVSGYIDDFVAGSNTTYIGGGGAPVASFTGTPTTGTAPLSVMFNDTSTNTPTGWLWDFGDSTTSTLQNLSHTYNSAGTYTVNLTATNTAGSNSSVQTGYITVTSGGGTSAPVASFTASTTSGPAPLAVTFTDTSTGSPTSWSWDFGDTTKATAQNPVHIYTTAGTYTVSLTATNAGGSTSSSQTITVKSGSLGVLPGYTGIYVRPSNANGILWNTNSNGTYYINPNGGGLNAVHITTDPAVNAGQVTVTPNTAGTFYLTDSGGRGYQDEAVLLLAVNGTIP
ncbi:MAG: PKD domain-containing protein, partial [Methanoregula sp.]